MWNQINIWVAYLFIYADDHNNKNNTNTNNSNNNLMLFNLNSFSTGIDHAFVTCFWHIKLK